MLQELERELMEAHHHASASKIRELQAKWEAGQVALAFCGHFSAGKSTLINRLCGKSILPSSPIPTSANVVTIRNGEPGAVITKMGANSDGSGEKERIAVPLDQVEAYCVNGADVEAVQLTDRIPWLGDRAALLDTPGVDSTDDAHRLSTESALHLADVVFYVMDYNHVQSEMNFAFAKQIADWGKPLYLIVNQIDKHRERELPFADYRKSVEQAFAYWHLEPAGIIYLSLKEPDHRYNEWHKLEWLVRRLMERAEALCRYSVEQSAAQLAKDHMRWFAAQNEPLKRQLLQEAGGEEEAGRLDEELERLQARITEAKQASGTEREQFRKELMSLLDNANLIPAQTRDLAGAYLESRKPGFKAGFLASKGKTAAEIERRLAAFHGHLLEQVQAHADWHVRDLLRRLAQRAGADENVWTETFEQELGGMTPAWLASLVNPGAGFTSEYTMNYAKSISAEVKSLYRKRALAAAEPLFERLAAQAAERAAELEARERELLERAQSFARLRGIEREEQAREARLQALLAAQRGRAESGAGLLPDMAQAPAAGADRPPAEQPPQAAGGAAHGAPGQAPARAADAGENAPPAARSAAPAAREALQAAAAKLRRAAGLVAPYPAMQSLAAGLALKAERLAESRFTIALFGAFSAGKSSFANALIGEYVLPVSPNPTTAAINRLMAPQDGWPHGTAKIIVKTKEAVLEEIRYSLTMLGMPGEEAKKLPEAGIMEAIRALRPEHIHPAGKPHYSFLKAVEQGWDDAEPLFGQEVRADLEQYRAYVAEEAKSCFVQLIELHYSSPLTDQGIVLVDTPGADSINARHTGVAFNYIKNADAILFVTYYNHAFSQADSQFLHQLGRVKDSFELDKMFFLVNAADLAASEEELQGVVDHVSANLLEHGIRFPRIYPVSSVNALDAKLDGNPASLEQSGLTTFERDFSRFIIEELGQMAIQSGLQDVARAAHVVRQWIQAAQSDEAERQRQAQRMKETLQAALTECERLEEPDSSGEQLLEQEIQELAYYVKQRVQFRFGELYNASFHPSTLREDGRDMRKALQSCLLELIRTLSLELSNEMLATSLRVEHYAKREAVKRAEARIAAIASLIPEFTSQSLTSPDWEAPAVDETLATDPIDPKRLWSYFKNAKSFFEGDGKQRLRQALEADLAPAVQRYVESHQARYIDGYTSHFRRLLQQYAAELRESVTEQANGLIASFTEETDVSKLRQLHEQLHSELESSS